MKLTVLLPLLVVTLATRMVKGLQYGDDRVLIWNAEAKMCLQVGGVYVVETEYEAPQIWSKRGAGALVSLGLCRVRRLASGDLMRSNWYQHFRLEPVRQRRGRFESLPRGYSAKSYRLATNYHVGFVPTDEPRRRMFAVDTEEHFRNDTDAIRFLVPNDDRRYGTWITVPGRDNRTEYECLSAVLPRPGESSGTVELQDCQRGNFGQYWHVCDLLGNNCTQT